MMRQQYEVYNSIAHPIQDDFYRMESRDISNNIQYLKNKMDIASDEFQAVATLDLLCAQLAIQDAISGDNSNGSREETRRLFEELELRASFSPLALIGVAMYFLRDPDRRHIAKRAALRAAFVAEFAGGFISHAHQTLIRVCSTLGDWGTVEASVLRICEYWPDDDSPDPALERDTLEIIERSPLSATLKHRIRKLTDYGDTVRNSSD